LASKAIENYRGLVPPGRESTVYTAMVNKTSPLEQMVGDFYWTDANKTITAYTPTITFLKSGNELQAAMQTQHYDDISAVSTITNLIIDKNIITFNYRNEASGSGFFSRGSNFWNTMAVSADCGSGFDVVPVTMKLLDTNLPGSVAGTVSYGYLLRKK
jgi:hypothetical protein